MSELKEKALIKMLDEMNVSHSRSEDQIHNFLCNQDDDELFAGVLNENKSINGAYLAMMNVALSGIPKAHGREVAYGFSPDEGFDIIIAYFKDKNIEHSGSVIKDHNPYDQHTSQKNVTVQTTVTKKPKKQPKVEKQHEFDQPDIFLLLGEEVYKKDPAEFDPSDESMHDMNDQPDDEFKDDLEVDDEDNEIDD